MQIFYALLIMLAKRLRHARQNNSNYTSKIPEEENYEKKNT